VTRFSPGERVRIREDFPPGHIRTPVYLRGKTGTIDRYYGEFNNAEAAAYGLRSPQKAVYKVRFTATELWTDYAGRDKDVVEADIYEHWLEKLA
jgi:nitrile hydratase